MFNIAPLNDNTWRITISGQLTHQDYMAQLIPTLEAGINTQGRINLLIIANDFHGWEWQALWDDLKMGIKHRKDFGRIAIVGDAAWEKYLINFCALFLNGEMQYFAMDKQNAAEQWVTYDAVPHE